MDNDKEKLSGPEESPEVRAEEELLKLGLKSIPENIQAVIEQQKTKQHPEGFEDIVNADSIESVSKAMRGKNIKQFIHAEGPSLWTHSKFAITLAGFLHIPEEKKEDLKLIMLYHDLGKTIPGFANKGENRFILQKELQKGKLYQPVKGHALEKSQEIEDGFKANGISGRKLEVFMTVVKNHMETSLAEMSGPKLVKLFEGFGKDDIERKEVAEMLTLALQVDSNAGSRLDLSEEGEVVSRKKANTVGEDFDKIWEKYQQGKKELEAGKI